MNMARGGMAAAAARARNSETTSARRRAADVEEEAGGRRRTSRRGGMAKKENAILCVSNGGVAAAADLASPRARRPFSYRRLDMRLAARPSCLHHLLLLLLSIHRISRCGGPAPPIAVSSCRPCTPRAAFNRARRAASARAGARFLMPPYSSSSPVFCPDQISRAIVRLNFFLNEPSKLDILVFYISGTGLFADIFSASWSSRRASSTTPDSYSRRAVSARAFLALYLSPPSLSSPP